MSFHSRNNSGSSEQDKSSPLGKPSLFQRFFARFSERSAAYPSSTTSAVPASLNVLDGLDNKVVQESAFPDIFYEIQPRWDDSDTSVANHDEDLDAVLRDRRSEYTERLKKYLVSIKPGAKCTVCYASMKDSTLPIDSAETLVWDDHISSSSATSFCVCRQVACLNCWCLHVTTRIELYQMSKMSCIECSERLEFMVVKDLLDIGHSMRNFYPPVKIDANFEPPSIQKAEERARELIDRYDNFLLYSALAQYSELRWCPKGGCGFAVLAAPSFADCPAMFCRRAGCDTIFCYNCRGPRYGSHRNCKPDWNYADGSFFHSKGAKRKRRRFRWPWRERRGRHSRAGINQAPIITDEGEVKRCPRCKTYVVKINDGTCNHISCVVCNCEFCWLCMKEITDMHYLSVSGCTFWGKQTWSPEKRILFQLGTLLGAPIAVGFLAAVAVPSIVGGIPIFIGWKVFEKMKNENKHKRRFVAIFTGFISLLVSPIFAFLITALGIPTLLAYIYVVMPISLIKNCQCTDLCCDTYSDDDYNNKPDEKPVVESDMNGHTDFVEPVAGSAVNLTSVITVSADVNASPALTEPPQLKPKGDNPATENAITAKTAVRQPV